MPDNKTKPKVLILEDEPVISKVLYRAFTAAGMEADIAENGLYAEEKLTSGNRYDIFIFDIRTPIVSGMQLYEYMEKNFPETVDKVIFMTGDYLNTATYNFLERTNRPFINKPFTPDQIMELIKPILQRELSAIR
jgi:DNA-binding NtrC family response regulator